MYEEAREWEYCEGGGLGAWVRWRDGKGAREDCWTNDGWSWGDCVDCDGNVDRCS